MAKINELVKSLPGGPWTIYGDGQPVEELQTIANPAASNPTSPANTRKRNASAGATTPAISPTRWPA